MSSKSLWLKTLSEMLKTIEDFEKPRDRLAAISQILQARNTTVLSSNNWMIWLGNPVFLDVLSDEQVEKIRVFWRDLAVEMLRFDCEITREVEFVGREEDKRWKIGIEPQ